MTVKIQTAHGNNLADDTALESRRLQTAASIEELYVLG
jgi:hypothetical protein